MTGAAFETIEFEAEAAEKGRLDKVIQAFLLSRFPAEQNRFTRSYVQKLFSQGLITIEDEPVDKNHKLDKGDLVSIELPPLQTLETIPQDIPIDIVYEDKDLLVVNKEKGMVVHPGAGNADGTLVNALLFHCAGSLSGINGVERPGIVHRIDKDTSGLLVVAKNDAAHIRLAEQIAAHTVTRKYYAVAHGRFRNPEGTVDAPIGRKANDRIKYCVTERNSKKAVTEYKVLEEVDKYSYLELHLLTGRTHQIRVHMEYLGHPLAGDKLYGNMKAEKGFEGQCLHAGVLGFVHPSSGEYLEFRAELPDYFTNFLEKLRKG
jgi:23S rRNA pseudouridine1911/1915/1917 synthase